MKLTAQLWKVTIDHEGEATLTFKAPLSELENVKELQGYIQKGLDLEINHRQGELDLGASEGL